MYAWHYWRPYSENFKSLHSDHVPITITRRKPMTHWWYKRGALSVTLAQFYTTIGLCDDTGGGVIDEGGRKNVVQ